MTEITDMFLPFAGGSGGGIQPWQFQPETYGAAGNGKIATDVASNSTATYTSATVAANASSGKNIVLTYSGGTPTWDWWLD